MRLIDVDALLAVSCVLLAIVSIIQSWQIYKLERRTSELWWKPVKHGRWEKVEALAPAMMACSECGWVHDIVAYGRHYCPNCGARMDGDDGD